jgi:6-phosphogluconolactonase (cycloisomerase 2 family)
VLPSLPDTYTGNSRAAEIEVSTDGRFLYASNRGYDSIAIFTIDAQTGHLAFVHAEPTQGATPRFFALSPCGKFLFAANEDSDTIVTFLVDRATGQLNATGDITHTGSPACIVFGYPEGMQNLRGFR